MNLYKIILSKTILRCQIQVNSIKVQLITRAIEKNMAYCGSPWEENIWLQMDLHGQT